MSAERRSSEGVKLDAEKVRLDLVPWEAILGAARVFTFGARKYGDRNWEKGIAAGRLFAALCRHVFAWWTGEDNDIESGEPHLDHAMCCLMMLRETARRRPECDDRPSRSQ